MGTGRVDFGLMAELPEMFVVSRFRGPDGRVVCSFDCSYSWHRVSPDERTDPPVWEDTSPQLRALTSIILVEATNGVILALRTCSYSPEFTRSFHRAIHDQAALPYDQAEHEKAVADIVRRLNTDQILERCAIRCEGAHDDLRRLVARDHGPGCMGSRRDVLPRGNGGVSAGPTPQAGFPPAVMASR